PGASSGARGRSRHPRLLRLVATRQLRVGGGVLEAVRARLRRLRDARADPEGERGVVLAADRPQRARGRRGGLMAVRGKARATVASPTLEEVGEAAGVSRATVSRVINNSPRVSASARAAVEKAIQKLGYSPNQAARSLVTRRNDAMALVVAEPEARFFSDPFFSAVVRGVGIA